MSVRLGVSVFICQQLASGNRFPYRIQCCRYRNALLRRWRFAQKSVHYRQANLEKFVSHCNYGLRIALCFFFAQRWPKFNRHTDALWPLERLCPVGTRAAKHCFEERLVSRISAQAIQLKKWKTNKRCILRTNISVMPGSWPNAEVVLVIPNNKLVVSPSRPVLQCLALLVR